ncbi:YbaB/EbfC family nucleoid-associated protein [Actinoalloteichus spitiensis]|uniref:YbaB/EbfC family nucleoid-associated protein n=1 Tax=Actinoalloteichus spitiensis TaxID=252394 RepID=UPI0003644B72|nr:YbaB/EbfC family nucleoid-associated protein [Actinoalloteichus spitiensis]
MPAATPEATLAHLDHQADVNALLADYRRSREQLGTVRRDLVAIRETASSPDRTVTATVGSQGALRDLTISPDAYRRHRPDELAKLVLTTVSEASQAASRAAERALAPVLPERVGSDSVLAGTGDLSDRDLLPGAEAVDRGRNEDGDAASRGADEDDSFDAVSWLRPGGWSGSGEGNGR